MKLQIDLKIFIFLIIFYFTKQIKLYSVTMLLCILHEMGHLMAGLILKMKPEKLEIMPWGLSVQFKLLPEDYNQKLLKASKLEAKKLIIAIAGPLVNVILIMVFSKIKCNLQNIIIYSNIIILAFNLIPIYPLDGGRILKSILKIKYGNIKAEHISNNITNITIIFFTALCAFIIYQLKNIAILIILAYLWYIVILENKRYNLKQKVFKLLAEPKESREPKGTENFGFLK